MNGDVTEMEEASDECTREQMTCRKYGWTATDLSQRSTLSSDEHSHRRRRQHQQQTRDAEAAGDDADEQSRCNRYRPSASQSVYFR